MKFNLKLSRRETVILSSLITLLPIVVGLLLWKRLPEEFGIFLDPDSHPDAYGSLPTAIFVPPLIMLVAHWIALFFTFRDPGNQSQNRKVITLVAWIIPILSNLTSYMTYALAMGAQYSVASYMQLALGLLFAIIGNYLPKTRPNSTIGIRIPWTFTSRHNWNATHRFGGKCWMIGGLVMAIAAFIPNEYSVEIMVAILLILIVLPTAYSYVYYLRQKAKGEPLHALPKLGKSGIIALVILLVFIVLTLFTGDLEFVFQDDHMTIEASYYSDVIVRYQDIEAIEYRVTKLESSRVSGFGSLRLQMGYFHNEEFKTFTQYTYLKPDAHIVLTLRDRTLVIADKTESETRILYETLKAKRN